MSTLLQTNVSKRVAYSELSAPIELPGGPPSVTPPSSGTVQANYPIKVTTQNGYSGAINFTAAFHRTQCSAGRLLLLHRLCFY